MAIKAARVDHEQVEERLSRKQLLEKAEEFRRLADEQEESDLQTCLAEVRQVIDNHQFTVDRVIAALAPKLNRIEAAPEKKKNRTPKVKYADNDGHTWTGQGRKATWLKQREEAGEDIEQYRV